MEIQLDTANFNRIKDLIPGSRQAPSDYSDYRYKVNPTSPLTQRLLTMNLRTLSHLTEVPF